MGNACDVKYVNYHVQKERATEKELGLPTRLVFGCIYVHGRLNAY